MPLKVLIYFANSSLTIMTNKVVQPNGGKTEEGHEPHLSKEAFLICYVIFCVMPFFCIFANWLNIAIRLDNCFTRFEGALFIGEDDGTSFNRISHFTLFNMSSSLLVSKLTSSVLLISTQEILPSKVHLPHPILVLVLFTAN